MKRTILCTLLAAALVLLNGGGPKRLIARSVPTGARIYTSAAAAAPPYTLTAWSELGMHCDDGKDYSIFSVLPPYNVIHSQLIKKGEPPVPITTGVTVSYIATADTQDSKHYQCQQDKFLDLRASFTAHESASQYRNCRLQSAESCSTTNDL